jgi:hypothetical protein
MFQCEQLIYIQMQKTGCSHIASLLANLFDGQQIGKHNAPSNEQIELNKYFISSIRNPWDWYLSLWTFGVQGDGRLMHRLTRRNLLHSIKSAIKSPIKKFCYPYRELSKDVVLWRQVYSKSDDVKSFRKWVQLMLDPGNSHHLHESYGKTAIAGLCGFMTYRYLKLCCRNPETLHNSGLFSTYTDLVQFEKNNCFIDFFIRQESLEDDFCIAAEKVRPLKPEEKERIYEAKKTNTSRRNLLLADYYDQESIALVHNRDKLLIDKFGYFPPKSKKQEDSCTL